MKKLKVPLFTLIFLILILLSGCKSLPESKQISVNPLDLLDQQGFIYFSFPKKCDPELYNKILENNGISNSKQITKYIDCLYASFSESRYGDFLEVQGAIQGNFPEKIVKSNLSKRCENNPVTFDNNEYDIFNSNGLEISVPSKKLVLFGRNNKEMLKRFDDILQQNSFEYDLDPEIVSYLSETDSEFRLICSDVNALISYFVPQYNLNLKAEYLKIALYPSDYDEDSYNIDCSISFENEMFLKAGKAILSMSFGQYAGKIEVDGKNLNIKGIPLKKEYLYTLKIN